MAPFLLIGNNAKANTLTVLYDDQEITISYPPDYPKSKDTYFVFSTKATNYISAWVGEVNTYLMDSPVSIKLGAVLSKALQLVRSARPSGSARSPGSVDSEDDEEEEYGSDDDGLELESAEEFDRGVAVLYLKKRWAKKEEEIRAARAKQQEEAAKKKKGKGKHAAASSGEKDVGQIFSTNAASGILTNDLLNIISEHRTGGIGFSAEAIDDNIYEWRVKMERFPDANSPLAKDLKAVEAKYGYSYIELQVSFTIDLYPFYPPMVKVVRPRLLGFMMGRVTSMELLKLSYWNPVRDMKSVLVQIQSLLQEWARLDTDNVMNNLTQYPDGAYTELEYLLMRLGLTCEIDPRANLKYPPPEPSVKAPKIDESKLKKSESSKSEKGGKGGNKQYWAKGTGYGTYDDKPTWDVNAYLAAQKEKDRQVEGVLSAIVKELNKDKMPPGQFQAVEESTLIPFLELQLRNDSLLDMDRHRVLYQSVFDVLLYLTKNDEMTLLLDRLPHQTESLFDLLSKQKKNADVFLRVIKSGSGKGKSEQEGEARLAKQIVETHDQVEKAVKKVRKKGLKLPADSAPPQRSSKRRDSKSLVAALKDKREAASNSADGASSKDKGKKPAREAASMEESRAYCDALRELQFDAIPFKKYSATHHYARQRASDKGSSNAKAKVLRLAQEQSTLATSLPLSLDSSVFIRVDEENMDTMRVLITGPDETPYSMGCFYFDVYFPNAYPNTAPLVNLQTTGNGSVRFNPNLYAEGKVCLSLLGTWSGGEGETWNAETSTFLQVVVSIQSLILVPMPYFNEPGYERMMGTPEGDKRNREYNQPRIVGTVQWAMVDQLKNPAPGFEDVIRVHFYLRKEAVLKQCDEWIAEFKEHKCGLLSTLEKHVKELKKLLDALERPAVLDGAATSDDSDDDDE